MIFAYNKEQVGDVLLVILEDTKDIKRSVERKGKVARVTADETGKTLTYLFQCLAGSKASPTTAESSSSIIPRFCGAFGRANSRGEHIIP